MWWWLLACNGAPMSEPVGGPGGRTVAEVWDDPPVSGATITLRGATVLTARTRDGVSVIVQDATTGQGLEIRAGAALDGWPPEVGTSVDLGVVYEGAVDAPRAWLTDRDDIVVVGEAEPIVTETAPDRAPRPWTLGSWPEVTVTSPSDPTGRASTDAPFSLDGRFGVVAPGIGSSGPMIGIVTETNDVALRTEADWSGTQLELAAVETTVRRVLDGAHASGAWVQLDATQVTPWSRGGRAAVVQDEEGGGLWVDVEGFGAPPTSVEDRATWLGEVRASGETWRLRTWEPPVVHGKGTARTRETREHGALVVETVSGLGEVDPYGERALVDGTLLDDRFRDLAGLPDPATLRAVVDTTGGAVRLAVLP
jgi:hypothetical protein